MSRPRRSARLPLFLSVLVLGIGSALAISTLSGGETTSPGTSVAAASSDGMMAGAASGDRAPIVAALGRIEPLGGISALSPPAETMDSRIIEILVVPGQAVREGDLLVVVAGWTRAEANLARARADVRVRTAEVERTRRTLEANRAEAEASLEAVEARLVQARGALARAYSLQGSAAVSAARVEELESEAQALTADASRARAQVSRYAGLTEEHPEVTAAREALAVAVAAERQAAAELEETLVRAPFSGTVIAVPGRLGQRPGERGVVRLAADGPMTGVLEVHQSRIGAVSVGARVKLLSEAFSGGLEGTVTEISTEVQRQEEIGSDPSSLTDARVFEVRVVLDERSSEIARRLINVQVVAEIETGTGT